MARDFDNSPSPVQCAPATSWRVGCTAYILQEQVALLRWALAESPPPISAPAESAVPSARAFRRGNARRWARPSVSPWARRSALLSERSALSLDLASARSPRPRRRPPRIRNRHPGNLGKSARQSAKRSGSRTAPASARPASACHIAPRTARRWSRSRQSSALDLAAQASSPDRPTWSRARRGTVARRSPSPEPASPPARAGSACRTAACRVGRTRDPARHPVRGSRRHPRSE